MISEGSCDTENWSNNAENVSKEYIIFYLNRKQLLLNCIIFYKKND